jgi:lipopolysaccharide biosynthesis glycosyltransferase
MNESRIPVFLNADDQYTVPTYITLYSMLYNHRGDELLDVYLLTKGDLTEKNIALLNSLAEKFPKLNFKILTVDNNYDYVSINMEHISCATLYRLMIPRIALSVSDEPIDKCIYIDTDLIVEGDIASLYHCDVEGYYLAGVADGIRLLPYNDDYKNILGIPDVNNYINAGVLLWNLKELNQAEGLRESLEEAGFRNDFPFNDQDALNSVLYGKIKELPPKFNVMPFYFCDREKAEIERLYGRDDVAEARKDPQIVHYINFKKPWIYTTTAFAGRWWKYVRMQDRSIRREYIRPFLDAHRLPRHSVARERCITIMKEIGIYWTARRLKDKVKALRNKKCAHTGDLTATEME